MDKKKRRILKLNIYGFRLNVTWEWSLCFSSTSASFAYTLVRRRLWCDVRRNVFDCMFWWYYSSMCVFVIGYIESGVRENAISLRKEAKGKKERERRNEKKMDGSATIEVTSDWERKRKRDGQCAKHWKWHDFTVIVVCRLTCVHSKIKLERKRRRRFKRKKKKEKSKSSQWAIQSGHFYAFVISISYLLVTISLCASIWFELPVLNPLCIHPQTPLRANVNYQF